MCRIFYHTQERREKRLTSPQICNRDDAWLGKGYYFWEEFMDAEIWGNKSKKNSGYYEIYESNIVTNRLLDTVFNEKHYRFWVKQVEKAAKSIQEKTRQKPTLKEVNEYFKEKATWGEVDGIIFQDIPANDTHLMVRSFYYRKRIQVVVFNHKIIYTFVFHSEGKCQP